MPVPPAEFLPAPRGLDEPQLEPSEIEVPRDESVRQLSAIDDVTDAASSEGSGETVDELTLLLTVRLVGQGSGIVTSTPSGIDCGEACTYDYDTGTVVTLAAQADESSLFAGFSGDEDCADGEVVLDQPRECIATFDPLFTPSSLVDAGEVELPVDTVGKAARIARAWLAQLNDKGATVGKIYVIEHVYVISIVSDEGPHILRDQLVIRRSDGQMVSVKSLPDLPDSEDIELPVDSTGQAQRLAEQWIESQQTDLRVAEIQEIVKIYLVDIVSDQTPEELNNQLLIRQRNGRIIPLL
jgi:hypothetical protein